MGGFRIARAIARAATLSLASFAVAIACKSEPAAEEPKIGAVVDDESPATEPPALPPESHNASDFVYPTECARLADRTEKGAMSRGVITVGVRARIAVDDEGTTATGEERIQKDIEILNGSYAKAGIRFYLRDVEFLPPNSAFFHDTGKDTKNAPLWTSLCAGTSEGLRYTLAGSALPLYTDSLPLVYVHDIPNGAAGYGARCGVVLDSRQDEATGASFAGTIAHEVGHFFGVEHTHECREDPGAPDDQALVGDRITDTPPDPGAKPYYCCKQDAADCRKDPSLRSTSAGGCTLDEASCSVTCPNGETPDAHNFMSYYDVKCRDRFSAEQISFMRCNLTTRLKETIYCPPDSTRCLWTCAATDSDPVNCGGCDKKCDAGVICSQGKCGCASGETQCADACVDIKTDEANCGGCGKKCTTAGYGCVNGACQAVTCSCTDFDHDGHYPKTCTNSKCSPRDDCNDSAGGFGIHPGAVEICNGKDDDCDGFTDENAVCEKTCTIPSIIIGGAGNPELIRGSQGNDDFSGNGPWVKVTRDAIFTAGSRYLSIRTCVSMNEANSDGSGHSDFTSGSRCVNFTCPVFESAIASVLTPNFSVEYFDTDHACDNPKVERRRLTDSTIVSALTCKGDTSGADICTSRPYTCASDDDCSGCQISASQVRVRLRPIP